MLAGPHRLDRRLGVEMEGQGDDHGLDIVVGQEVFVGTVDLHLLAGFVLARPLVLRHQARTSGIRAGAGDVAVKRAEDVVGADVGDRDHVEVVGIVGAQKHASLVARAENAHTERVAHALAVAEVDRSQARTRGEARGERAGEKISPRDVDGVGKILLADRFLIFRQVHRVAFQNRGSINRGSLEKDHSGDSVRQQPVSGQRFPSHFPKKKSRPLQPPVGRLAIASRAASSAHWLYVA